MVGCKILTGNVCGRSELGCHLGVQRDHHLFLRAHDGVTFVPLVVDPVRELIAENSRANIDQPLLRNFWQVDIVGEEVGHVRFLSHEF